MHFPDNYGAVLQAYALSHYFESLNCDTTIIDYLPKYITSENSIWHVSNERFRRNIMLKAVYLFGKLPFRLKQKQLFSKFRCNELKLTKPYYSYINLVENSPQTDFYFCGSDQIWNSKNETIKDPVYFLQFVSDKTKRYSYAVSGMIPNPVSEEIQKNVIPMIDSFQALAFREATMIETLQSYIVQPIKHVCDPVFLLDADVWQRLGKKHSSIKLNEKYILVYAVGDGFMTFQNARILSDKTGLPVYCISWSQQKLLYVNRTFTCSPYDFLLLFSKAEYVVTNSFHGTAFSIVFKKNFWVCETSIANQRLESIMTKLGIRERLLSTGRMLDHLNAVDYHCVNKHLLPFVQESKNYLNNIIINEKTANK